MSNAAPAVRPQIVVAAILTLTQADANELAARCPYEADPAGENLLYVFPAALDAAMIGARKATVMCAHYVKDHANGANQIKGEWKIEVPIQQTVHKNLFAVALPPVAANVSPFAP